jgi:hypothetical protein
MPTRTTPAGVLATSRIELANHTKDVLAEFNREAQDDKHFRELVLAYFKPEVKFKC